jgi:glyoxylase-like metal-dependent hydrolase (beta-lactamase superfamily II)
MCTHPVLHYPLAQTQPATGEMLSLRPGLNWVRMPLPFALNHINLWVLEDELAGQACWTVIDAGVSIPAIHEAWQHLWAHGMKDRPLGRMLATHMHPDHVGNAQWLIEHFSALQRPAMLWMSATDFLAAVISCRETTGYGGQRAADYFGSHGLVNADHLAKILARGHYFSTMVPSMPERYHRLHDGLVVEIGSRAWRCMVGKGHSPEHMALYCEREGVLISGDMLLPKISTNISVTDMEPEADALGLFLDSIKTFESLPPDTLVLPSHGHPFIGIHDRVKQLCDHHAARLDDIIKACAAQPQCAADLLPLLFNRALDEHQVTFALGEAVAHLNHLWVQGVLHRQRDVDGIWRFGPR